MSSHDLSYRILGVQVAVHCPDPALRALVQMQWGRMASGPGPGQLTYAVSRKHADAKIAIDCHGQATKWTTDEGEFVYELESAAIIGVQRLRSDLYFLHAAVGERQGRAYLFVARSGGGKSTTLWGLLHHGWGYLSDELGPIEMSSLDVHAYPRALCLKRQPPPAFPLPETSVETPRTWHVPVEHLPQVSPRESCPLAAIYYVHYCPDARAPAIRPISAGESAARLYANTLNQLAHANAGLDAAATIAGSVPGFALETVDLTETCRLVGSHCER